LSKTNYDSLPLTVQGRFQKPFMFVLFCLKKDFQTNYFLTIVRAWFKLVPICERRIKRKHFFPRKKKRTMTNNFYFT
jgi:hypothetical protein